MCALWADLKAEAVRMNKRTKKADAAQEGCEVSVLHFEMMPCRGDEQGLSGTPGGSGAKGRKGENHP